MSYYLRFAVKAENGKFVEFKTPEYDNPTYNVGKIFRKAMNFDFKQGTFYKVSEIYDRLVQGYKETAFYAEKYRELEPDNGWGSVETVRDCLRSVMDAIAEIQEYNELPLDIVYFAW